MHKEIPIDEAELPDEAKRMLGVVDAHSEHPLIQGHFFRVTCVLFPGPNGKTLSYWLPECHDRGLFAAMFWDDADGKWYTGGWLPVAHRGADMMCPPSRFTQSYLKNNKAFSSAAEVIDHLYKNRAGTLRGHMLLPHSVLYLFFAAVFVLFIWLCFR